MDIELGRAKRARRAYTFDDIAVVPSRRTRNPEDVSTTWTIDAFSFDIPVLGAPMDSVVSPQTAIMLGQLGGLGVLCLLGGLRLLEQVVGALLRLCDGKHELPGSIGPALHVLHENGVRSRGKEPQVGERRIGQPLSYLEQAPGDRRERHAGCEQRGKLPRRSQVAETVALVAAVEPGTRLLPLVEGSTVSTKYGPVKTDHVLFIASGAFHVAKPSDLIPELQGRFPIRVELGSLSRDDFVRILTEPRNALTRQYAALLATEGVELEWKDDGIRAIAEIAATVNERTEDIGARRLHTVLEKLLEELSFEAPDLAGTRLVVDEARVREKLAPLVADEDLSRFIL